MALSDEPSSEGDPLGEFKAGGRAAESAAGEANTGDIFHILSNQRRRYAVLFFLYYDPEPELRALSKQIAAWENGVPVDRVTAEQRRRVYSGLQQSHLPMMDDLGVISYDSTQHVIESTAEIGVMEPYLETVPGTGIPWCLFYLGLGTIGVVLSGAATINAVPISGNSLAITISTLLAISGAVHAYNDWRQKREYHDRAQNTD